MYICRLNIKLHILNKPKKDVSIIIRLTIFILPRMILVNLIFLTLRLKKEYIHFFL